MLISAFIFGTPAETFSVLEVLVCLQLSSFCRAACPASVEVIYFTHLPDKVCRNVKVIMLINSCLTLLKLALPYLSLASLKWLKFWNWGRNLICRRKFSIIFLIEDPILKHSSNAILNFSSFFVLDLFSRQLQPNAALLRSANAFW